MRRYGYLTKVEPTQRALQELQLQAWVTGRRRDQGERLDAYSASPFDTAAHAPVQTCSHRNRRACKEMDACSSKRTSSYDC